FGPPPSRARPTPGGSSRRSARWSSRPGCWPVGVGGGWTPRSWPTRAPPRTPSPRWWGRSRGGEPGVVAGRGRRVLDPTVLADAVATQDTVTQLVAAIRRVRRLVPAARAVELAAHDYDRPGKPACAWDDPQATQALVSGLVNDALAVLEAVAEVELGAEQAEAVALLALVAGQDVEPGERPGSWRVARRVAKDRVISTVDPQARHTRKTSAQRRDGYKGHLVAEP